MCLDMSLIRHAAFLARRDKRTGQNFIVDDYLKGAAECTSFQGFLFFNTGSALGRIAWISVSPEVTNGLMRTHPRSEWSESEKAVFQLNSSLLIPHLFISGFEDVDLWSF